MTGPVTKSITFTFRTIEDAQKLTSINSSVFRGMKKVRYIHITRTALTQVPVMRLNTHIVDIIDFDSNRIKEIKSNTFTIRAIQVSLENNLIESVHDYAFNDSKIEKLSFRGNMKLTHLAENCFHGIEHLNQLDLSQTSITKLPTDGLANLSVLRLKNTYTLKVIPSIYNFKRIKEAELTYPYHCCAFKHPKTHNQYNLLTQHECHRTRNIIQKKKHSTGKVKNATSNLLMKSISGDATTATSVASGKLGDKIKLHSYSSNNRKYHWITTLVPKWIIRLVRVNPQVRKHCLPSL